jgi:peroxiredoxin
MTSMMRQTLAFCSVAIASIGTSSALIAAPAPKPKHLAPKLARVLLTKQEEPLCRVRVGSRMPAVELPQIGKQSAGKLAEMYGKKATVVIFWKNDRRMTQQLLVDIGRDVVEPFGAKSVAAVGIAVKESEASAQATLKKSGASFTNLLDVDGKAFAQVGSQKLPRVYLVDPQGKILWFDIEYSPATRRELRQALRAVAGEPAAATAKK